MRRKRDLLLRPGKDAGSLPFPSRSVSGNFDGVGSDSKVRSRADRVKPRRLDRPKTGRVTGDALDPFIFPPFSVSESPGLRMYRGSPARSEV